MSLFILVHSFLAPPAQHHRIVRNLIGGPTGVGLTTFFNSRKQATDAPAGKGNCLSILPAWEQDSRKTLKVRRWEAEMEQQQRDTQGREKQHDRGGAMGINTYFNRKEQTGDKARGVRRRPDEYEEFTKRRKKKKTTRRSAMLAFGGESSSEEEDDDGGGGDGVGEAYAAAYGVEPGAGLRKTRQQKKKKKKKRMRGIRRITTDSRERWKDMDPTNLPLPARPARSRGSTPGGPFSPPRVPGMPFPMEMLPGEAEGPPRSLFASGHGHDHGLGQQHQQRASTASTTSSRGSHEQGPHQPPATTSGVGWGRSTGKKHFYRPGRGGGVAAHRRLHVRGGRVTASGVGMHAEQYDPMQTSVGGLLGSRAMR